jgi:hypothetical protein
MKRVIIILAHAALASSVLTFAAEARSEVTESGDRFRANGRSIRIGESADRRRPDPGMRFDRNGGLSRPGYHVSDRYDRHCYFPAEWPKLPPWPPFCN